MEKKQQVKRWGGGGHVSDLNTNSFKFCCKILRMINDFICSQSLTVLIGLCVDIGS